MATKPKTSVKFKPTVNRKEERRTNDTPIKKLPPLLKKDQRQEAPKPTVSKTAEFNRLVTGDFTQDFAKQNSRLFRIFISSTFSDFKVERNELYRRVFPPIKQRCAQLGYEFQVVDMRWGVSDTADSDHTADVICMDEIERCIDLSAGLNFLYLTGDRYGYMYVPLQIDQPEFESILAVAREENVSNLDLIEKWFQLDRNSSPLKYVYVPITSYFHHFEDQSVEQVQEKKQWQIEEKSLLKALRDSVDKAFEKKKLSSQQAVKYFQSITEREIRRGTIEKNRSNVIGVVRDFSNPVIETASDAKFFDSSKNERIINSINQLKTFCAKVTPPNRFKRFLVPWKCGGLNIAENTSHRQYIDELCQFLTTTILEMIANTCKVSNKNLASLHGDLLHHALFCREKTNFFFGREELLTNVHTRLESQRRNVATPVAFIAESGCGKTSFMARLAKELRVWYPTSAIFLRFLGTSAASTTLELVIRSLCSQLKVLYGTDEDDNEDEEDSSITFSSLVQIFHDRLKSLSKKRSKNLKKKAPPKPLFILLDAIDQLEDTSKSSFQFDTWLLRYLPKDVHIFLSFLPSIERCNLKDLFLQFTRNDETSLFTVPRLRPIDCEDIIRNALQASNRQLVSEQYAHLLATVEHNPKPLYLKLLIDVARRWTAYQNPLLQISLALPETIETAIEQLFTRLENRHGKEFVQYSLAYLVYGLNGISENELEDCLSINDTVLNEIYTHHDPPIPNTIHVPSLLCQSLLYSLKEYLSQKRVQDKHVLSFYHRKFSESTRKRSQHLRKQCHEHLIEIYSHEQSAFKRTITLKKRNNQIITDADRLINCQITNILNKRKLVALPHHCLEYGPEKDQLLRSMCLFNLPFLSCQLQSLGNVIFLDALRYCLRLRPHWFDLRRLYRAIWSIDDDSIEDADVSLILAEQILGFIDKQEISQLYSPLKLDNDLERLLLGCEEYCDEHDNSFRSLYAAFPQETGALAWSFSPVTHVLYVDEFYTLVILNGTVDEEKGERCIQTYSVAMISLQTGKVDKIYLEEGFDEIWAGYVTKNGNKVYLFGTKALQTYSSRTGDMIDERTLSWDNKSFCNKAYCMTRNEEQLIVANEWRVMALDEIDEDAIYREKNSYFCEINPLVSSRGHETDKTGYNYFETEDPQSGRIPAKNTSFVIENSTKVEVRLRCVGANDDYVLCLVFDENNHVLITLWSLNEHLEILPMRFAFISHDITSPDLFDLSPSNHEILYLATTAGDLRPLDILKVKINTKVQVFSSDETVQEVNTPSDFELDRLVCLSDDLIGISTAQNINLFHRQNFSQPLQTIDLAQLLFDWYMIKQDEQHRLLITIDADQKFISVYHQNNDLPSSNPLKIEFRAQVQSVKLIQTRTMMDNDEKKKTYILILLDDETIQLLDTNQLSQASLLPNGLFTRIRHDNINVTSVTVCEYESKCPLVIFPTNEHCFTPQYLHALKNLNIEYIAMFDDDQYYIVINHDRMVYCYSIDKLSDVLFQYDLRTKSQLELCSMQTYHSNIIIFMFNSEFLVLRIQMDNIENRFHIQSEQILSIPAREAEYSLIFTPDKRFLVLTQCLNLENDFLLNGFRLFACDKNWKISPIKELVTYIKSKLSSSGKIIGFRTYVPSFTRSELWVAYQGTILRVRLPSNLAELDIRSDYHCWMRHSLALYQQTSEKSSLSITITSLATQTLTDSCLASGGDDGSIVLWHLTDKHHHDILESQHVDEITALKFDTNTKRLFSASLDRTLAVWSPTKLLHVLSVHIPIDRIDQFSSSNILLARCKFWGFNRLMMFAMGSDLQRLISTEKKNINKELKNMTRIQACEVASWAV